MNDIAALLNEPGTTVAVVGATDSPGKYGGIIYRDLKAKGFTVFAVNPARTTVDGDPAYPSLADLPEAPTIVNYVTPAPTTLSVLATAKEMGMMRAWVQPGAEDERVMAYLDEDRFDYLARACIMVESRVASH